jgi:Na+/H+-translocating membrane pyrophosphatase
MGADLYESYCGSIFLTAALGASGFTLAGLTAAGFAFTSEQALSIQFNAVIAPMLIAAVGYHSFNYRYFCCKYQRRCFTETITRILKSWR